MSTAEIPNLRVALDVLRLAADAADGLTLRALSDERAIPRTTAFRILNTFTSAGFLEKRGETYHPGAELLRLGLASSRGRDLRQLARPLLAELAAITGETSHLALPAEPLGCLIAEVADSPLPVHAASRAGAAVEVHAAATGKVFLAHLWPDRLSELRARRPAKRTPATLVTLTEWRDEIVRTLARGYAIDDEEYHVGVRCLAAPVRDHEDRVVAAIGITAVSARFRPARDAEIARAVLDAAGRLTRALGGPGPAPVS